MLIRGRGRNRWRVLFSVAVVCWWSVFGAVGVTANAALCSSVPGVGVMVEGTSDWGSGVGGGGAGACCPVALVLGGGMGGVEVLSFVRSCRCELGLCPNPVADQGPILPLARAWLRSMLLGETGRRWVACVGAGTCVDRNF